MTKPKYSARTAKSKPQTTNRMWGGGFSSGPDEIMKAINLSLPVDRRLYAQDIEGSIAHAAMLGKQGIITAKEAKAITEGLQKIRKEIEAGAFPFRDELEDIHMNIEMRLKELIGETAGKLHTARSRNDQVATSFRLWIRDAADQIDGEFKALQGGLLDQAENHAATIMPGFTHLQTAQPVTFGHHLMAYVEMIGRDRGRLSDTRKRLNESPLGTAALAGTSFPIDRQMTAKALGFDRPMVNSLDAVSDRDFAMEFLSSLTIASIHLSRLAEEIVIWCSAPFKFITLSEAFTTGSSIMPQKRNPDAAELVRAKTGQMLGSFTRLSMIMKGLPLAYSKDMQEDKAPVFEAADAFLLCLQAMRGMIRTMEVNRDAMREKAKAGYATATDLADWLVRELGIPFRQSHHIVGNIVKLAERKAVPLEKLGLKDMQSIEPRITVAAYKVLTVEQSVASRISEGGTAPSRIREAIRQARRKYL